MSSGLLRNCGFRLRIHAVGAAEAIEVIDVDRTQVGLQRVEHARQRHALALRLDAIHVREQLRHAVLERRVGRVGIELALLPRLVQHLRRDARELVVAVRAAILHDTA